MITMDVTNNLSEIIAWTLISYKAQKGMDLKVIYKEISI